MIGAMLRRPRGRVQLPHGALAERGSRVLRAGDEFLAWVKDAPHAYLTCIPEPGGADAPTIVCGVFGRLFGVRGSSRDCENPAEFLARAYYSGGRDSFMSAEGEFSAFLYDVSARALITRTDRLGIQRCYYAKNEDAFVLSTDLQALLTVYSPPRLNRKVLADYFFLGYIPAPGTVYANISKTTPGHAQVFDARHWRSEVLPGCATIDSHERSSMPGADIGEAENALLAKLEQSVARRLDGQETASVLLTSGYDSTLCAAVLKSQCRHVYSYTIGFEEREVNENEAATKIAAHLGLEHKNLTFSADELLSSLPAWVKAHAEPWCHPNGLSTYVALGKVRKERGATTVFDGSGGDYLFRDFEGFAQTISHFGKKPTELLPRIINLLPGWLRRNLITLRDRIPVWRLREAIRRAYWADLSLADCMVFHNPWPTEDYRRLLGTEFAFSETVPGKEYHAGGANYLDRYLAYYRSWGFDASVGRAVMESNLQGVCSAFPYEDEELVSTVINMPRHFKTSDTDTKRLLQENLSRRFIPAHYFARRKKAMETPIELLLRSKTGARLLTEFVAENEYDSCIYNREFAREAMKRFIAGDARYAIGLWSLLTFEVWRANYDASAVGE